MIPTWIFVLAGGLLTVCAAVTVGIVIHDVRHDRRRHSGESEEP